MPDGGAGDVASAPGEDAPDDAVVRPFYLTRGRTRGRLALDALVCRGRWGTAGEGLEAEQERIFELCGEPLAVAELAARLQLPLGIVRVLLDDLVDTGRLEVVVDRALLDDDLLDRLIRAVERL